MDANGLIALLVSDHVHHSSAETWFLGVTDGFATCPITQGSLIRLLVREGQTAEAARSHLHGLAADERHEFWPDDVHFRGRPARRDHRRSGPVTDAYLGQNARGRTSRLATFDQALVRRSRLT